MNYGFWLPLWYLLITPLVSSDYPFGIFWLPLWYLLLPLWYLLITPLVSSDYPFGIFLLPLWYLLITPLVSSDYPFGIFWLPLWYLPITPLVSSDYPFGIFLLPLWYLLITPLVSFDYPFGIFWLPLWYLQTFLVHDKSNKHTTFRKGRQWKPDACIMSRSLQRFQCIKKSALVLVAWWLGQLIHHLKISLWNSKIPHIDLSQRLL